jgi:cytochrome c-type biogenesis protein CcmF
MEEIIFQGEHLLPGNLGHLSIVMAFASSLFATIGFFIASRQNTDTPWSKAAVTSFYIHVVSVLAIVASLFYIIHSHYYEYQYAWQHSSSDLPWYYMISCFWEGQEGSFLLWIFWHAVLGVILLAKAKDWRNPVMGVISLCQIALTSMLIGVKILGYKLGSSPFDLVRVVNESGPLFNQPDYLTQIKDGNGLNPLLQNYWMVIHPPTLFLGFACTIVPFAYSIAALIQKRYNEWIKPALPWALIGVMVLGTGIIMGGFWAYESLSFGGYWAWDPVENASLIPWLTLIGSVHVMLIHKSTGSSLHLAYLMVILTFVLVLYATFLTRSGILGDSSVHSFTDLGMSGQLLVFLLIFTILSVFLMVKEWKKIPSLSSEENIYSRDFWMFIGALVLIISSFQVLLTTSIPVINKIWGSNMAPPADPVEHYNKWQLPFAIIIAFLTGIGQLLKFKKSDPKKFWKDNITAGGITLILSGILFWWFELNNWLYFILLFASVYTILVNTQKAWPFINGKVKVTGASVAHIGFGLMLIGVLVSSANKNVISRNETNVAYFDGNDAKTMKENYENIYLEKGKPVKMQNYRVTYLGDSLHWVNNYYKVKYEELDQTGKVINEFILYPNGQSNPKMGFIANPDTRHYLNRDIFTYVSSVPNKERREEDEFINEKYHNIKVGDTIQTNNGIVLLEGIESDLDTTKISNSNINVKVKALLKIITLDKTYHANPIYAIENNGIVSIEEVVEEAGLRFRFMKINPDKGTIEIQTAERTPHKQFIIMKAIVFPYINFLWGGTIVMIIGFLLSIKRRIYELRRSNVA